jgi:hypothetical protein
MRRWRLQGARDLATSAVAIAINAVACASLAASLAVSLAVSLAGCTIRISEIEKPPSTTKAGATKPGDHGSAPPPKYTRPPAGPFAAADARLRRLLSWQYVNAIRDILGDDAANAVTPLADVPLNGFDTVGSASLSLGQADIELLEQNAFAASQAAVHGTAAQSWRVCTPASFDDDSCARSILSAVGRKIDRRSLSDDELTRWDGIWNQASQAYGDFDMGLEFAIAGMLQSPSFVYEVEVGANGKLTGNELASRLSFFLVGTTPSDDLLNAADAGELDTQDGVRVHARALLSDANAPVALHHYFDEKLGLSDVLPTVERPDSGLDDSIRADMKSETLAFVDDVVWSRNADARELFTGNFTFVNDELAQFYSLPLPGSGAQLTRVTLDPSTHRAGLLTQGAFLARFAHEHRTSTTLRGKFIRQDLMCQAIPAPPNNVNTNLPEPTAQDLPETTRDRMEVHMQNPSCKGCHSLMDPLGFALEEFDNVGKFRTHEYGLPVDTNTDLDGVAVADAVGLADALRDVPDVPLCLVRNLFRQATGHIDTDGELSSIYSIDDAFELGGYHVQDALVEIAASDAFRSVAAPEGAP